MRRREPLRDHLAGPSAVHGAAVPPVARGELGDRRRSAALAARLPRRGDERPSGAARDVRRWRTGEHELRAGPGVRRGRLRRGARVPRRRRLRPRLAVPLRQLRAHPILRQRLRLPGRLLLRQRRMQARRVRGDVRLRAGERLQRAPLPGHRVRGATALCERPQLVRGGLHRHEHRPYELRRVRHELRASRALPRRRLLRVRGGPRPLRRRGGRKPDVPGSAGRSRPLRRLHESLSGRDRVRGPRVPGRLCRDRPHHVRRALRRRTDRQPALRHLHDRVPRGRRLHRRRLRRALRAGPHELRLGLRGSRKRPRALRRVRPRLRAG